MPTQICGQHNLNDELSDVELKSVVELREDIILLLVEQCIGRGDVVVLQY